MMDIYAIRFGLGEGISMVHCHANVRFYHLHLIHRMDLITFQMSKCKDNMFVRKISDLKILIFSCFNKRLIPSTYKTENAIISMVRFYFLNHIPLFNSLTVQDLHYMHATI